MSIDAMKMAFVKCENRPFGSEEHDWLFEAGYRAAIEAAEKQEPVRCCNHDSDCAVHNEPAYPSGPCNCSLSEPAATYKGREGEYGYEVVALHKDIPDGTDLYTTPQPAIPDGWQLDAKRWNFVMMTEPYALNLWNALPKEIYQQERHLNNAIDRAMLAAAPKEMK